MKRLLMLSMVFSLSILAAPDEKILETLLEISNKARKNEGKNKGKRGQMKKDLVSVAKGLEKADLVIKNCPI